jgi:hypothetical protein
MTTATSVRAEPRSMMAVWIILAIAVFAAGAVRFIGAGLLPATRALVGDFGAVFPSPFFARLRPDFDTSQVWREGWYYGPMLHVVTLPLFLVPRWSMVPATWAAINLCAVGASFVLALRLSGVAAQAPRAAVVALAGLWLWYQPLVNCFAQGNIEMIELAVTLAAILMLSRGSGGVSGVLIGIAAMIKFLPVGFLGWLFIRGRWRAFAAGVATIALIAAVTAVTFGWRRNATIKDMLWAEDLPIAGFHESSVTSLFLHRAGVLDVSGKEQQHWIPSARETIAARAGKLASALFAAGYGVALLLRRRRAVSPFEVSVLFMAMFMIVPWNHDYYYIFALVPISVMFLHGVVHGDRLSLVLTAIAYALISPPVPFAVVDRLGWLRLPAAQAFTYFDVPVAGALLLWFAVTRQMFAEPATGASIA